MTAPEVQHQIQTDYLNLKPSLKPEMQKLNAEALYSQQKQDLELTAAHIMNSLLQNSDLN